MGRRYVCLTLTQEKLTFWVAVLQEIEREDEAWEQSRRKKPKHSKSLDGAHTVEELASQPATTSKEVFKEATKQTKGKGPSGFY